MQRAVDGISKACLALGTPVTGGNVSLYNQFSTDQGQEAIHPTPTIGMVGVTPDVERRATMSLDRDDDVLLVVGDWAPSLGASEYLYRVHGLEAGSPPALDLEQEADVQAVVRELIADGTCDTAHDVSAGGLAVAVAEMAIAGGRGATLEVTDSAETRPDTLLFGESSASVILAVEPHRLDRVRERCASSGVSARRLGTVGGTELRIALATGPVIAVPVERLDRAHASTFAEALG